MTAAAMILARLLKKMRVAVEVYQKATMLCCMGKQTVKVRGELTGWCQRTLFGNTEVTSLGFRPLPAIQRFTCRTCGISWSLHQADIQYHSGPLSEDHALSDAVYGRPGASRLYTATDLLLTAYGS